MTSTPTQKQLQNALDQWNQLPADEAEQALLACCGSLRWASTLTACRPFPDHATLHHRANNLWFLLDEHDWLQAFACHPRIGEARPQQPGTEGFQHHSTAEQQATVDTLAGHAGRLAQANQTYEQRFGFIYIVFANGRTAPELLALLEARLRRDRITELHEASRQQHLITALRMQRWLGGQER